MNETEEQLKTLFKSFSAFEHDKYFNNYCSHDVNFNDVLKLVNGSNKKKLVSGTGSIKDKKVPEKNIITGNTIVDCFDVV